MVMVVGGDSVGSRGQLDLNGATRHHAVAGLHTALDFDALAVAFTESHLLLLIALGVFLYIDIV